MNGTGVVITVEGNKARVEVGMSASCAGCASQQHCHGSSTPKTRVLTAVNSANAIPGDTVMFEADAKRVVFSAALIWILPILAMIVGYFVGESLGGGGISILAAFVFLGLSLIVLKVIDTIVSGGSAFYPIITRIVDTSDASIYQCSP